MAEISPAALEAAAERVRRASRVIVLTGAGVSAESGIPTFRGAGGLYEGVRAEDLASPEGFQRDPETVWKWYRERARAGREARPNAAHDALVAWERAATISVVTQNVDGLHTRAGSRDVIEVHGSIRRVRCEQAGCARGFGPLDPDATGVPMCPCGNGRLRPDVVWFGEPMPIEPFEQAAERVAAADLCLVVGTSNLVYPAASLPDAALKRPIPVIEINVRSTPLTDRATVSILGPAGAVLPILLNRAGMT
jgi:NAD-dependent deacetylase